MNSELGKSYQELRKLYPQHIPVLRVGNEYHLYSDEAIVAGKVLGIEPTSRRGTSFISFPHKELEKALPELIRAGHRVAIVNDIEKPETTDTPSDNRETSGTRATETEIGGALVDRLGDMGVGVSTDLEANRAALKAAKADKSDAGAIHYYKTPSGQQYGFSYKGRIYLDPTKIDAELPIHEYGHLWAEAMRRISPESWRSVVDTIKADKASWDFVRALRPELKDENEIAEEVIATFSGKRGAERLRAEYKKMHGKDADYKSKWGNIFQNISKAIRDFWKAVGDFLSIKYQSAEQIYDQVLKDFVDNMNPYQKVRDFLRARDAEYIQAAESGDIQKATNIFYDALRENIGNGITPYMSVGTYLQFKRLAKGVKTRDAAIIREAAEKIAPLIPDNAVLVPTPSHTGRATDMLDLANAIAEITGSEVADILRSAPRESQYQAKKDTGTPIASQQLGIMMEGTVPADKTAIVIDNVVDSGNTAEACIQALGKGVVVTLADSAEQYRHAASLRSAAPILRDKDGNIVPLTKRFNMNGSRYLGRRMYLRPNDPRFAISGTQVIPVGEKTLVGLHNISAEKLRKAIKMGGLANPSTAVINIASQNHEQYGDISLVMPSSLVDSKTGRNAGTFTGDIWSPTYPSVERVMDDAGYEKYYDAITKAFGDNEARRPILYRAKLDFDDYLDSGNVRAGLTYWYLLEKGIEPGDVYFQSGISEDIKKRFEPLSGYFSNLTAEQMEELLSIIADMRGTTVEQMKQEAQEAKARYQETIDDPNEKQFRKNIAQKAIDEIDYYGVRVSLLDNEYHRLNKAVKEDGKIDITSTLIAAQDIVQTQYKADFDQWLEGLSKRFNIKEVLFDGYNADGDRIYKPHTLANASRMMNQEPLQNAGGNGGLGATRGQLVERMETLADIRLHKDRLRPGTEEDAEMEEWNKMSDEWFAKILNPLSDMQKISDNPFSNVGYAESRLQEALTKSNPVAYLNKEYGYKIDPNGEWAKNLRDMVQRVKDLPTKYFETKFRRPVYLDEFANAVVPVGLPQDLRDGLTGAGMTLFEYDPAEQGSRRAATLKATADEGIRFSISGNTRNRYAEEMESIKNEAVNNGTFMQAPNGKPTNLDERQWLQVRTENFKRWFGDWQNDPANASKIVDENGEPRVVYHGTPHDFTVFGDGQRAWSTSKLRTFYFTPDYHMAMIHAGYERNRDEGIRRHTLMPSFLNVRNIKEISNAAIEDVGYWATDDMLDEFEERHDGMISEDGQQIVVLHPNQIKSASKNDGSFSEASDDIRFSISNRNNDIFYSNAERSVEGIKQDKATPEQWRAMIEKNGGLKAGEDKWLGLSDWLAQQRPTVELQPNETRSQFLVRLGEATKRFTLTKQQVLDYIRNNKIQIEEQEYSDMSDPEYTPAFRELQQEYEDIIKQLNQEKGQWYNEETFDEAFEELNSRHHGGDDFNMAFTHTMGMLEVSDEQAAGYFLGINPINDTRLSYTTEGLTNKREIALTIPTIEPWNDTDEVHFGDAGEGRAVAWVRFGDAEAIFNQDEITKAEKAYSDFINSMTEKYGNYFEQSMSDGEQETYRELGKAFVYANRLRNTKAKVLVIDEIQSKRHQEGREKGYVDSEQAKRYKQLRKDFQDADKEYHDYRAALWNKYNDTYATRGEMLSDLPEDENAILTELQERYERLSEEWGELRDNSPANAVPVAPFEKNWHELAMKRILRFAAENGYDKVAWTTGYQQAKRYDLGKQLEQIDVFWNDETGTYSVYVTDKGYDPVEDAYTLEEGLDDEGLRRTIGKDMYNRVMEQGKQNGWDGGVILTGDDLVIGTDGMKGFYDDMLPRFMQNYGKKWGATVGYVTMPDLEEGYQTMHSVDITDDMRRSVLEGQPMFSISGRKPTGTIAVQPNETRVQYAKRISETIKDMTPRNTTLDDAIRFSITVNHNSPYLLKKADGSFVDPETGERLGFDHRFMGKGEGAQSHGWGSYFSQNDIEGYRQETKTYKDEPVVSDPYSNNAADRALFYYEQEGGTRNAIRFLRELIREEEDADTKREYQECIDCLLDEKSWGERKGHRYIVEIPDDDGTNYIEEDKKLSSGVAERVSEAIQDLQREKAKTIEEYNPTEEDLKDYGDMIASQMNGRTAYEHFVRELGSKEAASKKLNEHGITGIHYDGRRDGECYVIFDENDAKITDHIRFSINGRGNTTNARQFETNAREIETNVQPQTDWEKEEDQIRFSIVNSRKKIAELEAGEKIKLYRAMAQIDGKLYPPMSSKDNESGKLRQPIELGRWEQSEERPDLAKEIDGKWYFTLKKDDGKSVDNVAYNPYFHTSRTPLNDQFTSAYNRGNLVIVETEVPASELTSGYKADKAHNAVGEMSWQSGPVSSQLPAVRKVVLTRWDKPVRVVPDAEVAQAIAEMLKGTDAAIPWNVVTPSLLAELDKLNVPITVGSGTGYKGKPRPNNDIRFAITSTSGQNKNRSELITEALVKQANNNYNIMRSALKKVTADLKGIRAAMRMQSDYDRKVVDSLLNLYNTLLQENGVWAQYMPDTTRRIATQIVHAIGKKNITEEVNTIMDHMVHAQAKAAQRQWDKLRKTPIDKINISGVVMQGKVALEGQYALKAMNAALKANMTIEQIEEQINQLMDMEDNATDENLKTQYKGQWIGLTIAAQHLERLQHLLEERQQLNLELQSARSNKALKPAARQQLVDNIKQAMRDNYIEQAEAYTCSTQDLSEYVNTQEGRAKDFIRRQDANRDKIRSYAQRDLEGLATNPNRNRTRGNVARSIWDAFSSPIRDLQSLLRLTGLHAPDGEGYLYNHFMRNWMDGADMERLGIVNASKTLDAKISELTHGKYKTWEEAARKINDASHNMFTITMLNGVDGKDMPVTEDIPLSAGNALYIYAVNKMNDGRMKLAGMNITEDDVKALTDKVREQFGQEILDVVDWVQSEYFSQLRNRYNPTHEALFGAPMDAIENYFPLRINAAARQQNEDLSEPDTDAARLLAGTSTGAIKRRTKNSLPLDVRNADFFQEVIRHISQMERWNAFAQWNRDANILFSDINFRNRIKGMKGTIYGEGDKLYNYMKDAFRVAIGTYKPKTDTFSEITLNMAKGVTSAKINFRVFTALKQIASFPAFFTYMQDGVFVQSYLRNWLKPHETMKWARENLPNFEKRVSKRDMGDMRLMQRTTDWQWNKRVLEWSQKYGMAANVYFDTLTCATGARAVYDSRLAEYLKKGYPQEQAEQRARQDAELAFNTSQQSSEGAFMSAVQMDRNLVTAALTVFRTSPIQYTRNFFYHTRNLLRKFQEGRKEEQIAFRMGQYKNDGLTDEQARKAAEKDYNKSIRSDIAGFVVYGALLNILWRLVGQVPYLLFGDDDDKKKQILDEAASGGAWFSPFTGLLGGGIVESALDGNGSVADMFAPELPFTQDVKRAGQYLENDKYAEFANQALSVAMQSGTGFDPQTAGDMIQRIVTTIDSEEELSAAEQALRISQALLSIPQSQYEQQLVDRVVADDSEYDAALEDYIRYQKVHTAPLTWWMRGDESDEKAEENAEKRFDLLLNERDKLHNPEDYEE